MGFLLTSLLCVWMELIPHVHVDFTAWYLANVVQPLQGRGVWRPVDQD